MLVGAKRAGTMPAILREATLRPKHAMDDPAFRNCVKAGLNVDAALVALSTTTGGRLRLPDNGETMLLGGPVTLSKNGLVLEGGGSNDTTGSVFQLNAANAGLVFSSAQSTGLTGVRINGSRTVLPTSGAAVTFNSVYDYYAERLWIDRCFNGIDSNGSQGSIGAGRTEIRQLYGAFGFRMYGTTAAGGSYGAHIHNLTCDAPYPSSVAAGIDSFGYVGAIGRSTSYALGKYGMHGTGVYACVGAGTTASSGGPNGATGVAGTSDAARQIADGSVTWQFVFNAGLVWILMDSFAYSLKLIDAKLINGMFGVRMADTFLTGSSYPMWAYLLDTDADHALSSGIDAAYGVDLHAQGCWVGSTLAGSGVIFNTGYKGEGGFFNGSITGGAQTGILINGGRGISVIGNLFAENSHGSPGVYHHVTVAPNVNAFVISNNMMIPTTGLSTQATGYPVVVSTGSSDGYVVANNVGSGHVSGNTPLDGGTGLNKTVTGNVGY